MVGVQIIKLPFRPIFDFQKVRTFISQELLEFNLLHEVYRVLHGREGNWEQSQVVSEYALTVLSYV